MTTWRYEISLLVLKKYFSTLEEKFRISARPCNSLYFSSDENLVSSEDTIFIFHTVKISLPDFLDQLFTHLKDNDASF